MTELLPHLVEIVSIEFVIRLFGGRVEVDDLEAELSLVVEVNVCVVLEWLQAVLKTDVGELELCLPPEG